jgi:ABC-type Zn2+ transport system substrate-binding protein/surface adhesin
MQDSMFKRRHHDEEHDHEHTHNHGDGHTHLHGSASHSHTHTDADGHTHTHDHGDEHSRAAQPISDERANALLDYMIAHNKSHTQELRDFAATLEASGKVDVSAHIVGAVKMFTIGTASLEAAKAKMGGSN